jgi:hypothetical protein
VAQRGGAATKRVGANGAGPGPNAVRPYLKILAKKTRIYGIAMQTPRAEVCATRYHLDGSAVLSMVRLA